MKSLIAIVEDYQIDKEEVEHITDEVELSIVDFLTKFAKGSRYYNIDALTGVEKQTDPLADWKEIQEKIKVKHGLVNKPLPKEFIDFVNSNAVFIQHDEEGNLVSGAENFYKDSSILDLLQGYSVFHTWKIIQVLTDKLRYFEYKHNLFPALREFFPYFIKDWDKHTDVLTWKDWNYIK